MVFGSVVYATPVWLELLRILIIHSSLVKTPTWNIFDLAALTEILKILSASYIMDRNSPIYKLM